MPQPIPRSLGDLEAQAAALEKRLRRRTLVFTAIPALAGILLAFYASRTIADLSAREASARAAQDTLRRRSDSVEHVMTKVGTQFLAVTQALAGLQALIESKASYLRSVDEARFLIGVRMRFDSLHTALDQVGTIAPEISAGWPKRTWTVVIASSKTDTPLLDQARLWRDFRGIDSVGVYLTPSNQFALAVWRDGTFTTAYRLTVELQRSGKVPGAYFEDTSGWGPNLLH